MSEARIVRLDDFRPAPQRSYPYMSVDWDAIDDECRELSDKAELAYCRLIRRAWQRGAPLPDDDHVLAKVAGFCVKTWRKIRRELEALFDLSAGTWAHHQLVRAWRHIAGHAATRGNARARLRSEKPSKINKRPHTKDKTSVEVQSLQTEPATEGESLIAALAAEGRAALDAIAEKEGDPPEPPEPESKPLEPAEALAKFAELRRTLAAGLAANRPLPPDPGGEPPKPPHRRLPDIDARLADANWRPPPMPGRD